MILTNIVILQGFYKPDSLFGRETGSEKTVFLNWREKMIAFCSWGNIPTAISQ
jgi:hypothetical protein